MNVAEAPEWLPHFLVPFFTLSYPTPPPPNPDSFPNSSYYGTGKLDACLVLSGLVVLAVLREIVRLGILEPFARHCLTAAAAGKEKSLANGHSNGSAAHSSKTQVLRSKPSEKRTNPVKVGARQMTKKEWMRERSVIRFAEQGWPFLYYCIYWTYGLVSDTLHGAHFTLLNA
jgi:acyl-CoA-dependent ceramide synthase